MTRSPTTALPYSTADADQLLGLADTCIAQWRTAARDPQSMQDCEQVAVEWQAIRPVLVKAPALSALVDEAVEAWSARFANDEDINGGDLVEWFAGWLQRAQQHLAPSVTGANPIEATVGARHYRVGWEIDIWADTPVEAAQKALAVQRKPDSIATVFNVRDERHGQTGTVDLGENVGAIQLPTPRQT